LDFDSIKAASVKGKSEQFWLAEIAQLLNVNKNVNKDEGGIRRE
jgi:hypothetical protein